MQNPGQNSAQINKQALLERPCVTRPGGPDDHAVLEQLRLLMQTVGQVPQRKPVALKQMPKLRLIHRMRAFEPDFEVNINLAGQVDFPDGAVAPAPPG